MSKILDFIIKADNVYITPKYIVKQSLSVHLTICKAPQLSVMTCSICVPNTEAVNCGR